MVDWRTSRNQCDWSGCCCAPRKRRYDFTAVRGCGQENRVWPNDRDNKHYRQMKLDPKKYGLSKKVVLTENDQKEIIISIDRKSRIIMKDGIRIVDQARQIQLQEQKTISVKTSAPVCSKTKQYLQKKGIAVRGS